MDKYDSSDFTYQDLFAFFIPIAVSVMLVFTTHTILNSAMARTAASAAAIASYAIAKSVFDVIRAPTKSLERMFVAQYRSKLLFKRSNKIGVAVILFSTSLLVLVRFTGLGHLVFVTLMGIKPSFLPQVEHALTIFIFFPTLLVIKASIQALVTLSKRTVHLTISTVLRIVVMFAAAAYIVDTGVVKGGAIGAALLLVGMSVEILYVFWASRKLGAGLPDSPNSPERPELSVSGLWRYFLPLVVAQVIHYLGQPSINAGLSRTVNAEVSIATYALAYSFAMIFLSTFFKMHQVVLVFVKDRQGWKKVLRFSVAMGLANTAILLSVALLPAGRSFMQTVMGVPTAMLTPVLRGLSVLAFVPLILCLNEAYSGLLMLTGRTSVITAGKIGSVVGIFIGIFLIRTFFPGVEYLMGCITLIVSFLTEGAVLYMASRRTALFTELPKPLAESANACSEV